MRIFLQAILPFLLNLAPDFSVGLEWGYTASVLESHRYYYESSIGSRVSDKLIMSDFYWNGDVLAKCSLTLAHHNQISLLGGYGSVRSQKGIPLSIRYSYYPESVEQDGWQYFCESGRFLSGRKNPSPWLFRLGSGYHLMLNSSKSLDILAAVQCCIDDYPVVTDIYTEMSVPENLVYFNLAGYLALNLSMCLNF